MQAFLIELMACPACHGDLNWTIAARDGEQITAADVRCKSCSEIFSVRDGIGLFLTSEFPREDLWEEANDRMTRLLASEPAIAQRLMETPVDAMAPADLFFRGMVLEERGAYHAADQVMDLAMKGIYSQSYRDCHQSQLAFVVDSLATNPGPVVDLASGRGGFVERLARHTERPVVATDFSPRVLRGLRDRLDFLNIGSRVSYLAFDARRTPFRDGAIQTMTSNLGLPNIKDPLIVVRELRRVVGGTLSAISHFYPENDANAAMIDQLGFAAMLYINATREIFLNAGWQVDFANRCPGRASPTPKGVILEGAGIDGLPVADTMLEWCVLRASRV